MNDKSRRTHKVAVIGYVYRKGRFLLLKRQEPPQIWVPPGGRLHLDEDPAAGLQREVREETGLEIRVLQPANIWFGEWQPGAPLLSIDFLVEITGGELRLSGEHSAYAWASAAELAQGRPVALDPEVGFKPDDFRHAERLMRCLGSSKNEHSY